MLFIFAGIVSTQGALWKKQRGFTHTVLKDFGMGKNIMQEKVTEEIQALIEVLSQRDGQSMNTLQSIYGAVTNIIYSLIFGERCEYDNPKFIKYMDDIHTNEEHIMNAGPVAVFPFLRHLPGDPFHLSGMYGGLLHILKYNIYFL